MKHTTISTKDLQVVIFILFLPMTLGQLYTQPYVQPHAYLNESATLGSVVTTIRDMSQDQASKIARITYSGSDDGFYTQRVAGQQDAWNVILNRTLDYETETTIDIRFQAQGQTTSVAPSDVRFILHVHDTNDNPPQFQQLPYNAEVNEDATRETTVYTMVSATDRDTGQGGTVTFQLQSVTQGGQAAAGKFNMDPASGTVTLTGSLDYETTTFYHYRVVARDHGTPSMSSTTDLFITVKDVQDTPPVFTNIPYVASVYENTPVRTSVLTVKAVDQDRAIPNEVNYSVFNSTCPGAFDVDGSSGVVSVSGAIDRDIPPLKNLNGLCIITVKATEQNGQNPQHGEFTATATVAITVDDVNDNPPVLTSGTSFSANISENSPPGTPLQLDPGQQIIVSDIDQGSNSAFDLSLYPASDTFELVSSRIQSRGTVQLRVKDSTRLDYETSTSLIVKIRVTDNDPSHSPVTATVTVRVLNMNEFTPNFTKSQYTATVQEGSPPGTSVAAVSATDADDGVFGDITYTLSNARGLFQIDANTGEVTVASRATDREKEASYFMVVVARDGGGVQQTVPLSVAITDSNDNSPVFLRDQYYVILDERSRTFSRPVTVQATDADEAGTENSNVTYSITSTSPAGLASHFHLDPVTGLLTVTSALDYESLASSHHGFDGTVNLAVTASDRGSPRHSASVTVAITVNDLNDETPQFKNTPYSATVPEGNYAGRSVLSVTATDADGSAPNNVITYSIESGGQDLFRINPDNGTITVSGKLDHEVTSSFTLNVMARDRAGSPRSSSSVVTIHVTDVNDEKPTFGQNADVRLDVNETTTGTLYNMSALDPDSTKRLRYSILYGQSSGQAGSSQPLNQNQLQQWVAINANTGAVRSVKALDRTAVQKLVIRVLVNDTRGQENTPQTDTATLTITVLDINNHTPQFTPGHGRVTATIRENMGPGTALVFSTPLRVADQDEDANSLLGISVVGDKQRYFEVVPSEVQSSADLIVRVKDGSILDYEQNHQIQIKLMAREKHTTRRRSSTVTITLTIQDENDHSPVFSASNYTVTIPENTAAHSSVVAVHATDGDGTSEFNATTYSLEGEEDLFTIDSSSGVVSLVAATLDYDVPPRTYQLTVVASDPGGLRALAPLIVSLSDVNDLAPVFDKTVYTASLKEGTTQFDGDLVVHASDGDEPGTANSSVSYSIVGSQPASLMSSFGMQNRRTGVITVKSPIDYESLASNNITLTVKAADGGSPQKTSTASVHITVQDLNDHSPTFSFRSKTVTVLENATVGTQVFHFNATDIDGQSPNNEVNYIIDSGDNEQFTVNSSGVLTVSRGLDREKLSSYSLVVLAVDRGSPQNTGTATLSIDVDDVNDVSPEFSKSSDIVTVNENSRGVVYNLTATDPDVNRHLQFALQSTTGFDSNQRRVSHLENLFRVDRNTGKIRVNDPLDREAIEQAVLVVTVKDTKASVGRQTATGTVTISVRDVDDNPPVFSRNNLTVTVDENAAQGVPINMPQILVSDADQGENSKFRLKVSDSVKNTVQVIPATATGSTVLLLRVGSDRSVLDYEQQTSLDFQIIAEGIADTRKKHYCNVTLSITNVNDNLPRFDKTEYSVTMNESSSRGTHVVTVHARDGDSGHFGDVQYSLLGDDTLFTVNAGTGQITTAANATSYDREKTPEFFLTVMATDGGNATTTTRVHVTLNDINDNPPAFVRPEYSAFMRENAVHFETGVTVQATDNDQENTRNSEVHYSLQHSSWSSFFSIEGRNGSISVAKAVDFEALTDGALRLTVIAQDRGQPRRSATVSVIVTVQDENDFPPEFHQSVYRGNVTEGSRAGTSIVRVNATDGDGSAPNNAVFYLIASGGSDKFKVDSNTGWITTVGDIDREAQAHYSLVVEAVDKGSPAGSASVTVNINVLNINDDIPVFRPADVSISTHEEQAAGTVIYNFAAVDNDQDASLKYTVLWDRSSGQDENLASVSRNVLQNAFAVGATNGAITIKRSLDRETIETATLVIKVQDMNAPPGSSQSATGTVSIQVVDVDDHPPSFSSPRYTASISENPPANTPIQMTTPITVSDIDKDHNSEFSLKLSNYTNCLEVIPSRAQLEATVLIRVIDSSCFDYEKTTAMTFAIIAEGIADPRKKSDCNVTLNISNLNDNLPRFDRAEYTVNINESSTIGTSVVTVHARDGDRGHFGDVQYSLLGDDTLFTVSTRNGLISTASHPTSYDREKTPEFFLTVMATDGGNATTTTRVHVILNDVNDNPPVFVRPEYSAFMRENAVRFETGVTVLATDNDQENTPNRDVTYSLQRNSWSSYFGINGENGTISVVKAVDYDVLIDGTLTLTVVARDGGRPQLSASVHVNIAVQDENDFAPRFHQRSYSGTVTENSREGTSIVRVNATDRDGSAPNNAVFYLIVSGGNDKFKVDSNTGLITTIGDIDREAQAHYSLVVEAVDKGSPAKSTSVTVSVNVRNVNDYMPVFRPADVSISTHEEQAAGTVIYNFTAVDNDQDALLNYTVLWGRSSGLDENLAAVDKSALQRSFAVDVTNGSIKINHGLDRETIEGATLVIRVQDMNAPSASKQTATGTVHIQVVDVDDHPPSFSSAHYTASISENPPAHTPLQTATPITVSDLDKDHNSEFNLILRNYTNCLEIVPSRAQSEATILIRVIRPVCFDYEKSTSMTFEILAEGIADPRKKRYCNVTLSINNVNDNLPRFNKAEYSVNIDESSSSGTSVVTVHASDGDRGHFGDVQYSLLGDNTLFAVNATTGLISTASHAASYDREKTPEFFLTVMATDGGNATTTTRVHVTLNDVNDNNPTFLRPEYSAFMKENVVRFETGVTIQATDNDQENTRNSDLRYSLQHKAWSSHFSIDDRNGTIGVASAVDYEVLTDGALTLTVIARDMGHPQLSASVQVIVTVQDENDFTPAFNQTIYHGTVAENSQTGTSVTHVNATDGDGSAPNNAVFYLIASGGNDKFKIDSNTGLITTIGDIDREAQAHYSLVVEAVDKGSPAKSTSVTVSVNVRNVNDYMPVFRAADVSISTQEEQAPGTVIYNFTAVDNDQDALLNYTVLWGRSSGLDENLAAVDKSILQSSFAVDSTSGSIKINHDLDRETIEGATLVIQVRDMNAPSGSKQTATGTVSIQVVDVDDHSPSFSSPRYTASISENSPTHTPIQMTTPITVTDVDKDRNSEFNLTLPDYTDCLEVVPSRAQSAATVLIRVIDSSCFDYEKTTVMTFEIIAEGIADPRKRHHCNVTLNVNNVNDNLPHFEKAEYNVSINESPNTGTSVVTVHATDHDRGNFGDVRYSLLGGDTLFSINPSNGLIMTASQAASYDREKTPEFFLTVMATDGGNATTTTRVHVTLNDVNDNYPVFVRSEYSAFMRENVVRFETGVTIQSTDNDQENTPSSEVHYSLQNSTWSSHFSIDDRNGTISVVKAVDFEALNDGALTLIVTAQDRGRPRLSASVPVIVTVQDENDHTPAFQHTIYSGTVDENSQTGTSIARVIATDRDGSAPNNAVFYLIVSGGNDKFKVDSNTGLITTIGDIDREAQAHYSLVVEAVDKGSPAQSASVTVSVNVRNVNDYMPVFRPADVSISTQEEQAAGTVIYNFAAVDNDQDALLNYTVLWGRSSGQDENLAPVNSNVLRKSFAVDVTNGSITINRDLDREKIEAATLIIQVRDMNAPSGSNQTATGTLSIQVVDVDDHPPTFSSPHYTANISENSPTDTPLQMTTPITVSDIDKDRNSVFNLTLSNYTDCLEVIPARAQSAATVLIRVIDPNCFDYEKTAAMSLEIIATSDGDRPFTQTSALQVNIINVNDETPSFTQTEYRNGIDENLSVSTSVITVRASDKDSPPYNTILYSLQGGDNVFSINNITGEVQVAKAELDYETRKQYKLTVEATDTGGLRDSAALTITLRDVNDNAPQFARPEYQAFVKENDLNLDINITATDRDEGKNSVIVYNISSASELPDNFTMDAHSGRLRLRGTYGLDFEALPNRDTGMVHLVIVACDLGSPAKCSNVSLVVTVEDENDNAPVFGHVYNVNMSEDATLGASLVQVSATDADGNYPNNNVFYVMSGGGNKFKMDSSNGRISRAGALDSDTQDRYNLTVSAIDGGSPARSASTVVRVRIIDINDEPPTFEPDFKIISVNESNGMGQSDSGRELTSLWAEDPDDDSRLLYDVVWSASRAFGPNQETLDVARLQESIEIDPSGGRVLVHSSLDREKLSRAVLVVNVTDQNAGSQGQTSTGTLTINVLDVNDHKPQFNQTKYTAEIQENAVEGNVLSIVSNGQMTVIDSDTDQNCDFSVQVEGEESKYFVAVPSTARSFALVQLRVLNGYVLDYEKRHTFNISVRAMEIYTRDHFSDTITVTLNVIDVNDNDPIFTQQTNDVTVPEASSRFTNITRITAADEDSGTYGEITYSLEGDAAKFTINTTTGDLLTADDSLDRESKDTYLMTVVATDGGGRRRGARLTIKVTDINDETPRFQSNYSTKIAENSVDLSPSVVLQARDGDQPNTAFSNVTYHMRSCNPVPCSNFSLDQITGHLAITSPVDYERVTDVTLIVVAKDQGSPPRSGSATVTVQVEDVNDIAPAFSASEHRANITENTVEGTPVTTVSAHDADGSAPNNVTFYVLDSGPGSDKFRVNSTSGNVTVGPGAVLDRETGGSYNLTILALDRGDPPLSATTTLMVSLTDVNDEDPVFDGERQAVRIDENASEGHQVALMRASDQDTDASLVYTWLLEESQATTDRDVTVNITLVQTWFTVNASTGEVTVSSQLDRELAEVIVLKVMVNDTHAADRPQTAKATLTVTLNDINDNAPEISGSTSLSVSEAVANGTEVAYLTATDADRDQTVTFSVVSDSVNYFNISSDGKISLQRQIDRETTPTVTFTAVATDSVSPRLSTNITITVTVLDANDNSPRFQNTTYEFSVPENAAPGSVVMIVNASDADKGPNAEVTFDFADNVLDFVINKTTGAVIVDKPLDRESHSSYSFSIAALDNPTTDVRRRTTQRVSIDIKDINDNSPTFTNLNTDQSYTAVIDETKQIGTKVLDILPGSVQASDIDEGVNSNLSFYLTSEDGVQFFRMDEESGEVFVNSTIRGFAGTYTYTVTVRDHGHPSLDASANLTIEVKDENLNDPYFVNRSLYSNISIPECSEIGSTIVTFRAEDDDRDKETNGLVRYYFDNATSNTRDLPYFHLNPDTGELTSARRFNREDQARFQLGIIAQDKGLPNSRYTKPPLKVTILINDGNDNDPKFNVTQYSFVVDEEQDDVLVGRVYAHDLDDYKRTCYSLEDSAVKDNFQLSTDTSEPAELRLVKPLDRENPQEASFILRLTATDCTPLRGSCDQPPGNPSFATVHVTVRDVNDNPPNFTQSHLTFGVASTADAGHVIANLQDYVLDPDLPQNSVHGFYPLGEYQMDDKLSASFGTSDRPIVLTTNGSLTTRSALPGDAEGFIAWEIMSNDTAGNDTVLLKIYVVPKDKLVKITFFSSVEELRQKQDQIIRDLSSQTGVQFVADDREAFEGSSGIDPSKSILVAHAVQENDQAMDANQLMDFLDHQVAATNFMKTHYKLVNVQTFKSSEATGGEDRKKTEYILGAVICVLVIAFLITLYLMLNNIRRFKRKLKAATIETYAMSSDPKMPVPGLKTPQTNPMFGKDEILSRNETDDDQLSNQSDISLDNNSVDIVTVRRPRDEDEQEMTLDLGGEDGDDSGVARPDGYYLNAALEADDRIRQKIPNGRSNMVAKPHRNGVGPRQNGMAKSVNLEEYDGELDECESTDI